MANMKRKVRCSLALDEMFEIHQILSKMKESGDIEYNSVMESVRKYLRLKLTEEEEGILATAYTVLAEPKVSKYSEQGLGFEDKPEPGTKPIEMSDEEKADFNAKFAAQFANMFPDTDTTTNEQQEN